jgi:hypothetical protein
MQENRSFKGLTIGAVIIILALAGLAVYALSIQSKTQETTGTESNTNVSESQEEQEVPTPSERVTITFTNNGFEPNDLIVKKGSIIVVLNESSNDVQFSSDEHPSHRDNDEMNLPVLSKGQSESFTATKTGTWGFHDHLNESKTGTITVTE